MSVERRPDGTTRGGNEPPDEVQDTPAQKKGYDAAVRGERVSEPVDEGSDAPEPDTHEADRLKNTLADQPNRRGASR